MRWLAVLALVTGCATAAERPYVQIVASYDRASALLPLALDAARSRHLEIAAIDTGRNAFLAIEATADASAHVVYLVNIEPLRYGRKFRQLRPAGKHVAIAVTPLAFANGRQLSVASVDAQTRARDLLLAIYDRTRSERELF